MAHVSKHHVPTASLLAILGLASGLVGCGDGGKKVTSDAPQADASIDAAVDAMLDGAVARATVGGTVAVSDVTLLDPAASGVGGVSGGAVIITFSDLTQGGGTVVSGTTSVGSCIVTKFDPTHPPNPSEDAGAVTITNNPANESPATGLLKTVGSCVFQASFNGYVCISNSVTNAAVTAAGGATTTGAGTVDFVFASGTFTGEKLVGSYLMVNGFANAHFDSGASAFPVVGQAGDTLVVANPAGTSDAPEVMASGVAATVLNGFNPVPAAGATADFLGAGGITITKPASSAFPAISTSFTHVAGQGWALSDPGDPTHLPLTGSGQNIVFGCGANTSTCGQAGAGQLTAMIVTGRATKQDVTALAPFQMPTDVAGTNTWEEFTCVQPLGASVTLNAAAHQALIDFTPTRVEVRVINAAIAQVKDPSNAMNETDVVAGHALVGHTDPP